MPNSLINSWSSSSPDITVNDKTSEMVITCTQELVEVRNFFLVPITHIIKLTNQHRKLQRRGKHVRAKKNKLVHVPNCSILRQTTKEVSDRTEIDLQNYVICKKS